MTTAKRYPVLASPMHPNGWCPVHTFEGERCTTFCIEQRVEFARIQRAYERYWLLVESQRRHPMTGAA